MGLYEYVLGNFFVPAMLLTLALLSLGKGRRQLHSFIMKAINMCIHVGGYKLPVFPLMTIVNIINFLVMMEKISNLRATHSDEKSVLHTLHEGEYLEELLLCYRNLMLNICSCLLVI